MQKRNNRSVKVVQVAQEESVNIQEAFEEYQRLKLIESDTKKRIEKLKAVLDKHVDETTSPDNTGSRLKPFTVNGALTYYKREARKKFSINDEKAETFFAKKKLLDRVRKTREERYWDEQEIEQLVTEDTISVEDIEAISDIKVTYASVLVKPKVEEGE